MPIHHLLFLIMLGIPWLLLINGCAKQDAIESVLDDYLRRINRVTASQDTLPGTYHISLTPYPRHRDLYLSIPATKINLLDFLALHECDLQTLVGERNSGLGRVMADSQILIYEHDFLLKAQACRGQPQSTVETTLLSLLDTAIADKTENLPKRYWNATFASAEFQALFSFSAGPIKPSNDDFGYAAGLQALQQLLSLQQQLGQASLSLNSKTLEQQLFLLQSQQHVGSLLLSMDILTYYLSHSANTIEQWSTKKNVCFQGQADPKTKILQTIFYRYYIAHIQPYLSLTHRESQQWLNTIDTALSNKRLATTTAFDHYYKKELSLNADNSRWQLFNNAIAQHTQAWQTLFQKCNLMPNTP